MLASLVETPDQLWLLVLTYGLSLASASVPATSCRSRCY
jgi:hypothetical protein